MQNKRDVPLAKRPRLDDEQMRAYGRKLTAFAEHCHDEKVPLSFHHHMATAIETENDVDRLMNFTGEAVGAALRHRPHHLRRRRRARAWRSGTASASTTCTPRTSARPCSRASTPQRQSFLDAVLLGVFTVPGDGMIDFKAVAALLAEIGYEGWVVVEAEQDPKKANPLKYAKIGHEALSEALTQAGYTIEE